MCTVATLLANCYSTLSTTSKCPTFPSRQWVTPGDSNLQPAKTFAAVVCQLSCCLVSQNLEYDIYASKGCNCSFGKLNCWNEALTCGSVTFTCCAKCRNKYWLLFIFQVTCFIISQFFLVHSWSTNPPFCLVNLVYGAHLERKLFWLKSCLNTSQWALFWFLLDGFSTIVSLGILELKWNTQAIETSPNCSSQDANA